MLRIVLVWLGVVADAGLAVASLWELRRFARAHPLVDREGGLPAYVPLVRRQMWFAVSIVAVFVAMIAVAAVAPGEGPGRAPWLVLCVLMLAILPVALRTQSAVRRLPCSDEGVQADRDALTAIWEGAFLPPRDMGAALVEARAEPPESAATPPITRIAGMTTVVMIIVYYFNRYSMPESVVLHPFGFVLQSAGVLFAAGLVVLGVLARGGNVLGAWSLVALAVLDRVGWIAAGRRLPAPVVVSWVAFVAFYAWAALALARARRARGLPPAA